MPDTDSTPPPTSEEVQQRAVRHGPVTVRGTSREDGAYCIWCKEPWPCFDYRLADAYMVVVGQLDEAVHALEAFVFHTNEDGHIDYVASDYAIESLRSIQEKGAEGG